MSNHLYADGATHNDHHKEINIQGNVTVEALKELANGFFADAVEAKIEPADSEEVIDPDELSPSRQEILECLLHYVTKGDWIAPATIAGIQKYLKTVLNAGEKRLTGDDARMSADLWKLLEQGRGDRVKLVMQNLIGYFVSRRWLAKGSPALNKAFFGSADGYSNIDKGNPRGADMSQGFRNVMPLLEKTSI